jgi:hypothetical protein
MIILSDLIGMDVEMPEPNDGDSWNNTFVGTIVGEYGGIVTIKDQDDDCFDISWDRIADQFEDFEE